MEEMIEYVSSLSSKYGKQSIAYNTVVDIGEEAVARLQRQLIQMRKDLQAKDGNFLKLGDYCPNPVANLIQRIHRRSLRPLEQLNGVSMVT